MKNCQEPLVFELADRLQRQGLTVPPWKLEIYLKLFPADLDNLLAAPDENILKWFMMAEKVVSSKLRRVKERLEGTGLIPLEEDLLTHLNDLVYSTQGELEAKVSAIIACGYRSKVRAFTSA